MMRRTISRCWLVPLCLTVLLGGLALPASPVGASTLQVTNCTDTGVSGDGSLRGQIAAAGVGDTIVFNQDCTGATAITLTTLTLTLMQNVTIDGTGHTIAVDGNRNGVVFTVNSGVTASLNALTIQDGSNMAGGGGILNSGTLSVTNSTLSNNEGDTAGGGGILNGGTLTVTNSTISNNVSINGAGGGGIKNTGTATVTNSTLSGNGVVNNGGGGGIANSGTLTVTNSTLVNNSAPIGGGIANLGGTLTVTNSTLWGNLANRDGGGIAIDSGTTTVTNCTISGNDMDFSFGGGGISVNPPAPLTLTNTIVAGNTANRMTSPDDLGGTTITSGGHNLIGTTDGSLGITNGVNGDIVNPTPLLGPLGNNGGPTQTIALLVGSPAIDAGNDAVCAATGLGKVNGVDQRGITRPQGAHCDIGAYEYQAVNPLPSPKPPGPAGGPPHPLPGVRPAGAPGGVPNPLPVRRP